MAIHPNREDQPVDERRHDTRDVRNGDQGTESLSSGIAADTIPESTRLFYNFLNFATRKWVNQRPGSDPGRWSDGGQTPRLISLA